MTTKTDTRHASASSEPRQELSRPPSHRGRLSLAIFRDPRYNTHSKKRGVSLSYTSQGVGARQMKRRRDGRYCIKWTDETGAKHYAYGTTVAEARARKKQQEREVQQGIKRRTSQTLDDYIDSWQAARAGTVTGKTEYNTVRKLRAIRQALGQKKLRDITHADITDFRAALLAEGRTAYYINARIGVLHTILGDATAARLIPYNPAERTARVQDYNKAPARDTIHRALTADELRAVFAYLDRTQYRAAYRLMLYTGARAGEVLALTWDDIDEAEGVIHINKTVTHDASGRRYIAQRTKTTAGMRDIPLTDKAKQFLPARGTGRLFSTKTGDIVTTACANNTLRRILRHLPEVSPFGVHALRDTYATIMVDQGCPPHVLRDLMGHSTIAVTMDLYYHNDPANGRAAMEKTVFPI